MAIAVTITVIILNTVTLFMIVSALRLLSSSRVLWSSSSSCLSSSSLSSSPPDRLPCRFLHCREIQHQNTTAIFSILTDTTLTIHVRLVCIKVVDIIIAWSLTALSWSHAYHHYLCSQHHGKYRHHDHHQQPPPLVQDRGTSDAEMSNLQVSRSSQCWPKLGRWLGWWGNIGFRPRMIFIWANPSWSRASVRWHNSQQALLITLPKKWTQKVHFASNKQTNNQIVTAWLKTMGRMIMLMMLKMKMVMRGYLASTFVLELEKKKGVACTSSGFAV